MFYKKILISLSLIIIFTINLSAQDIASGIKLIKNEKFAEAKKYFRPLTNTKSGSEAYFYLGQIYFLQDKLDSARASYLKGIEADKNFPLNYAGLVKIYVAEKNTAMTNKNEEEAIDLGDDNPEVYIILSEAYSNPKIKNYDKAIELLNTGNQSKSKYAPTYIALGKVYLQKANGTDAAKNLQTAIDMEESNAEALTLKARIYVLVKNYNEATTLLNEAITKDPTYSPAYNELAELNSALKNYSKAAEYYGKYIETSEITLEKRRKYAQFLYLNKEYSKAINILEDVIKTEPENPVAIRMLAYSYLRLEEIEKSMSYFKKLFEMPSIEYLPADYENYADLLGQTGNDSLAIEYMYKIYELDSTRTDVLSKISVKCFQNKDWDCVITTLGKKKDITSQEYFDLGKAYYFLQDYANADTSFGTLISRVPELAVAHFWKARVQANFDPESDSGFARPYYEQFILLSKEDTTKFKKELLEAYSYLGYYFFLQDDKQNSLINWEKVAAIDPTNEQAKAAIKELRKY